MPVDIDSDEWNSATSYDPLKTEILSLLWDNQEQAFSVTEIESHLHEEHPYLFPADIVGEDAVDVSKAARQSVIATMLDQMYWRSEVTFQHVSPDDGTEAELYFTSDGIGIAPVAEINEVKNPNPDSTRGKLSSRFRDIEKNIDEEVGDLEERIEWLEFRIREELGT
ncbi:hypothetical protein [Haloarcula sp. JP-L23]|uniref:hypothetical protein n=1 Tax=Haloarcula sp. JP-L23 TaxID=2716717 RepID=UPI00140E9B4D|nr:hypothetical protein G9465_25185 [Haloarcula sp. JP-L23]